ncbi:lipocalin family protein [bacterium]|nr:lipocalin family protein [bacterium]
MRLSKVVLILMLAVTGFNCENDEFNIEKGGWNQVTAVDVTTYWKFSNREVHVYLDSTLCYYLLPWTYKLSGNTITFTVNDSTIQSYKYEFDGDTLRFFSGEAVVDKFVPQSGLVDEECDPCSACKSQSKL